MNCWDILGIEPTRNRAEIEAAYQRQRKFADGDELQQLEQAFYEATGQAPAREKPVSETADIPAPELAGEPSDSRPLTTYEHQVVREVAIQVRAMLNDPLRMNDVAIWRAIVAEPPADQLPLRRAIGKTLEAEVRPMAENGAFPEPVVRFLSDWFEWYGLAPEPRAAEPEPGTDFFGTPPGREGAGSGGLSDSQEAPEQPQLTNFLPHVVGWIVGLVVLYSFFNMLVGG